MSGLNIFDAIFENDQARVKKLLEDDPKLAVTPVEKAKLFEGKILHWIYAGDIPLHLAAAGYRVEIIRLLLKAGANPNSALNHRASGPLHYAADACLGCAEFDAKRQVESICCLLEAGAKINAQDKNGATPLHRAVRTRGAAAVKYLLGAGANPLLKNKPGSMAFHLAVQNTGRGGSGSEEAKAAQREIIKEFLAYGVSVKQKDGKGQTVLEWVRELLRE